MIVALLRAEFRKIISTRLWWGLAIPVVVLSLLVNVFGGVFTEALGDLGEGRVPVLLGSLAYALGQTALFAAVFGAVATAGEFRHRTVTTTYLTAPGRGAVLAAKMISSAGVGAVYAVLAAVSGLIGGSLGQGSAQFPEVGALLAVLGIGVLVCGLWAAFGAGLGTVLSNQATVLVLLLVYVLLGELLVSVLLTNSTDAVAGLSAYLPVNAGETALYDIPAGVLAGQAGRDELVSFVVGVTGPPPWWGALLVLTGWTLAAAAVGWWAGARRDIT